MTLLDAWTEIKRMEKANLLSPKQVYAIVSDYGVFKANPRLQIIAKIALQNGLWDIVKAPTIIFSEIEILRKKLDYYGFSDEYIQMLFIECGFKLKSYDEDNNPVNIQFKDRIILQGKASSIPQTSNFNPLTSSSSNSDVERYLNSIFEIDKTSFQKYGLTLQRIHPIEWKKGAGYHHDKFGAYFSFEIIGNTNFQGDVELEVYDLNGFLRNINYLKSIYINGKYSIVNENIIKDLCLPVHNISKIILHIGVDGLHRGQAFYGETKSILRYEGVIENETDNFEILHSQILYATNKREDNLSVFFRYKFKNLKNKSQWFGRTMLSIVLFDINGQIRQKISLTDYRTFNLINIRDAEEEHCMFSFSEGPFDTRPSLKMPFDEIGKIVFIEE